MPQTSTWQKMRRHENNLWTDASFAHGRSAASRNCVFKTCIQRWLRRKL